MILPKKKSIQDLRAEAYGESDYLREDKLDSEDMRQLADVLESHASLADFRTWLSFDTKEFGRLIKFLRGE